VHRAHQSVERERAGSTWIGDTWNLVFTPETGDPLYGPTVARCFQALLKAAGLPRQRFHDLRHGCATYMLTQGVPLRVAMDVLGHNQVHVTAHTYSHVMPGLQRDVMERVGTVLRGPHEPMAANLAVN